MNLKEKILLWEQQSQQLKQLKKTEMELRKEICQEIINGDAKKPLNIATTAKYIFAGTEVVAKSNTTLKIEFDIWDDIKCDLDPDELKVITYKPALNKTVLNSLDEDSQVYDAIYEVPASPTLLVNR